jgi:RTX calcium-binding nonapeptide repeat (4 copies)
MSAHLRRLKSSELIGVAALLALLAALLYAAVVTGPADAQRRSPEARRALAAHLLKLDPGGRVGGTTIVGISNGDLLLGVANRINFMVSLGSGERIVGGNRADQLGALGKNNTINGGAGDDLLAGGPGHDTLSGGGGNDLISDTKGTATIHTGGGKNVVEVADNSVPDRVLCKPGSVDRIYASHGDYIEPSCRKGPGSQVAYHQPPATTAQNNGCTDNPARDCTFLAASGRLEGFWWSQKIPQRECPPTHPYLIRKDYVPFGVNVPFGVEVSNVPNVDYFARRLTRPDDYVIGAFGGSVTNWTFSPQEWRMWFHCTSDSSQGWCHERPGCRRANLPGGHIAAVAARPEQ